MYIYYKEGKEVNDKNTYASKDIQHTLYHISLVADYLIALFLELALYQVPPSLYIS